jgi:hypothetical protein
LTQPLARPGQRAGDRPLLPPQLAGGFRPALAFEAAEHKDGSLPRGQALHLVVEQPQRLAQGFVG